LKIAKRPLGDHTPRWKRARRFGINVDNGLNTMLKERLLQNGKEKQAGEEKLREGKQDAIETKRKVLG